MATGGWEHDWRVITPKPEERALFVASTGQGKSTLVAALAEYYHHVFPTHQVTIFDPKHRHFASRYQHSNRIFPDGFHRTNHGRRDGVAVNGTLCDGAVESRRGGVYVIQDIGAAVRYLIRLYNHADVRLKHLLIVDEWEEYQSRGGVLIRPWRRLIKEGREMGIGIWGSQQRPRRIDKLLLSESKRLYIGKLFHKMDRDYLAKEAEAELSGALMVQLPRYTFLMVNQEHPEQSQLVKLPHKGSRQRRASK